MKGKITNGKATDRVVIVGAGFGGLNAERGARLITGSTHLPGWRSPHSEQSEGSKAEQEISAGILK